MGKKNSGTLPASEMVRGQASTSLGGSLPSRLCTEIPKPKDWQAFQRNCALLFREILNDPHLQEYGRGGQDQHGIDLLGRRDCNPDHHVAIQCRHVNRPLRFDEMLSDCRAAVELPVVLKELIFATTGPDDTGATNAASEVEQVIRGEGHDLRVVIYGWNSLQTQIATSDTAYAAFFPSCFASSEPIPSEPDATRALSTQVAAEVVEQMRNAGLLVRAEPRKEEGPSDEDPPLHARIDTYRDLFKDDKQIAPAERGLLSLLSNEGLTAKPWARYRIETNLGTIALEVGREADAASRYEKAFDLRPQDPNAIANLALARLLQGRTSEADGLAQRALDGTPRANHAITNLLHAKALTDWDGDPVTLIPADLAGSPEADLGLAEFFRRRSAPGWALQVIQICRSHLDLEVFKRLHATAILSIAVESGGFLTGGGDVFTNAELSSAADALKSFAEHLLACGFSNRRDLGAYLSNAGMLLRLAGRHNECEELLSRGITLLPEDSQLRRLLALAQHSSDDLEKAILTLSGDQDPENRLLAAELRSLSDPRGALTEVLAVDPAAVDNRLARLRWDLAGEMALRVGDAATLDRSVAALRDLAPDDPAAAILELRGEQKNGLVPEEARRRLRTLAASLPSSNSLMPRFALAEALYRADAPGDAADLLEDQVDLSRPSPAGTLYLQSLGRARRDVAFREALARAASPMREDPVMLWGIAAHAWNTGDLAAAEHAVESLLALHPDHARGRLLRIEILVRQDRASEVFKELDAPVEALAWKRPDDRIRIAQLLSHFGYTERTAALSYRLFLETRDMPEAWSALISVFLKFGRHETPETRVWDAAEVRADAAVDLQFDDGSSTFFILEPDPTLRRLDGESWELEHPLARLLVGKKQGDRFVDPDGREGVVAELRHKYVARFHYVIKHYSERFPEESPIRRHTIDPDSENGLDFLIEEIRGRVEWFAGEAEQYRNGPLPLAVLALRVSGEPFDVALNLAERGIAIKVTSGTPAEQAAGRQAILSNRGMGCVLDPFTLLTAWRLGTVDIIGQMCGRIQLARSTVDHLRVRIEHFRQLADDDLRQVGYADGKLVLTETPKAILRQSCEDLEALVTWAEHNADVHPQVLGEEIPVPLREHIVERGSSVFDSLVLAMQSERLFITDDGPMRDIATGVGYGHSAWLHQLFNAARDEAILDEDRFVHWTACLIDAGQQYLGVSAKDLLSALDQDSPDGNEPGFRFDMLSKSLGGRIADPLSHTRVAIEFLSSLWAADRYKYYRQKITGLILSRLLRGRSSDFGLIVRSILSRFSLDHPLHPYVKTWAKGHFIPDAEIFLPKPRPIIRKKR